MVEILKKIRNMISYKILISKILLRETKKVVHLIRKLLKEMYGRQPHNYRNMLQPLLIKRNRKKLIKKMRNKSKKSE